MTREHRQDVLLVAFVVSVLLHVVLMLWVKPWTMTSVSSPRRMPKHGPITLHKATPLPSPKEIRSFADVSAAIGAPVAGGAASAPSVDESSAMAHADMELSAPEMPLPEAKLAVEDVVAEISSEPMPMVGEDVKVSAIPEPGPSFMSHEGSDIAMSVPVPSVPVIEADTQAARPAAPIALNANSSESLVIPDEVMSSVDRDFVELEKLAVRRLIDVDDAGDMSGMVDVRLEKSVTGGWTYFRATVTPKAGLHSVPKDVVILLDASGSIGYDRLSSCRKAAKNILRTCTNTGDRFNLVAFRDRFSYAFKSWQECNATSFAMGDKWLSKLAAHGRTDVFDSIRSVLTLPREPSRPLIAMVITDGDANSGVRETKEILSKFTELNDGLVSVYMYGVRKNANRELIDVLTHGNRGESLVYDDWKAWNAGAGIEGLSERFRDPLLTDLRVVFAAPLRAVSYPSVLKNLYRGNSVEITGRVPGTPASIDFSLKGLAGRSAYEGLFRVPISTAVVNPSLPAAFATEFALASRVR